MVDKPKPAAPNVPVTQSSEEKEKPKLHRTPQVAQPKPGTPPQLVKWMEHDGEEVEVLRLVEQDDEFWDKELGEPEQVRIRKAADNETGEVFLIVGRSTLKPIETKKPEPAPMPKPAVTG